jgi:hypothetical protein
MDTQPGDAATPALGGGHGAALDLVPDGVFALPQALANTQTATNPAANTRPDIWPPNTKSAGTQPYLVRNTSS